MSAGVDWALSQEGLSCPKQLLLVGLTWIADEDGVTFKSQTAIAARLGKDARWVRQHLPELAAAGLVSRLRRHRANGSRTTDLIVLNMPRTAPLDLSIYSGIVGDLEPGDREPSGENPPGGLAAETCRPTGENPPAHKPPLENTPSALNARVPARADEPPEWSYERKKVPPATRRTAFALLDAYRERTGQPVKAMRNGSGKPSDELTRITGALLDHPEVTAEQWQAMLAWTLDHPWWHGTASIGAVFGPGAVVRNLAGTGKLPTNGYRNGHMNGNGHAPTAEERRMERQRKRLARAGITLEGLT